MPTKEIEEKARRQEKSSRLTKETLKSLRTVCLSVVEIEDVGLQMWLLLRLRIGVVERLAQGNVKQCGQRKLLYALKIVVVV